MPSQNLYKILLPIPVDKSFSYVAKDKLHIGQVVRVPFRNKEMLGVVWEYDNNEPEYIIKEIIEAYPEYKLSETLMEFIIKVAQYNFALLGWVLKMTLNIPDVFLKPILPNNKPDEITTQLATLSEPQEQALAEINKNDGITVLDGVTGSGKTEVYLHSIAKVLQEGGQALVLLPEIALTSQLMTRFKEKFPNLPIQWHSQLTPKQRKQNWIDIASGNKQFVVGARSALFLPFSNLKLIVVDEEHDQSFKQEEQVIYNARDMAILRGNIEKIPIILASATPSIETLYNIEHGKYHRVKLQSRFKGAALPDIKVVDMRKEGRDKNCISKTLALHIVKAIECKEQVMLFLNRRGYSSLSLCKSCFAKIECPDCNFWLVKHKSKNNLQCHYCGFTIPISIKCSNCGEEGKIESIGTGVEKVAEEIESLFPTAKHIIISSDATPNYKAIGEAVQKITNQEVDIIIGTQMITKGLHFPKINLVGIVDADSSMISGDPRALERTYQVLQQVTGRAGRESQKSDVIIQTYNPDNIILQNLIKYDIETFIKSEMIDRKIAQMPPFSRLVMIKASGINEQKVQKYMQELVQKAPIDDRIDILGPSVAPIPMLKKRYRYRLLIKADRKLNIQMVLKQWLDSAPVNKAVTVKIDIDPYNFS